MATVSCPICGKAYPPTQLKALEIHAAQCTGEESAPSASRKRGRPRTAVPSGSRKTERALTDDSGAEKAGTAARKRRAANLSHATGGSTTTTTATATTSSSPPAAELSPPQAAKPAESVAYNPPVVAPSPFSDQDRAEWLMQAKALMAAYRKM